jgi:hypothetical protein
MNVNNFPLADIHFIKELTMMENVILITIPDLNDREAFFREQ